MGVAVADDAAVRRAERGEREAVGRGAGRHPERLDLGARTGPRRRRRAACSRRRRHRRCRAGWPRRSPPAPPGRPPPHCRRRSAWRRHERRRCAVNVQSRSCGPCEIAPPRLPQFRCLRPMALGRQPGRKERDGRREFRQRSVAGKRSAKRARVLLAAKLQTASGEIDARLRDLSRKGALVECLQVPPVGSEVVFVRGATACPRASPGPAPTGSGSNSHHMIDEHEVLVQLGSAPPPKPQSFRRPGYPARPAAPRRRSWPRPGASRSASPAGGDG